MLGKEFLKKDKQQQNDFMETNLYVFGASGHGKVVMEMAIAQNQFNNFYFVDDAPKADFLLGKRIYKTEEVDFNKNTPIVVGIGNNHTRKIIANTFSYFHPFIQHPSAIVLPSSVIKEGSVIMPQVVINSEVKIGKHCIINSAAVIEHDCVLHDFVHVSPKAALAGNVSVGEGTHIGIGAVVIQGVKIGKWSTIGAGAVILKDVPDFSVVVGNPGKIIRIQKP